MTTPEDARQETEAAGQAAFQTRLSVRALTEPWGAFECLPHAPGRWSVGIGRLNADGPPMPDWPVTGWDLTQPVAERIAALHNHALAPAGWVIVQRWDGHHDPVIHGGLWQPQDHAKVETVVASLNETTRPGMRYDVAAVTFTPDGPAPAPTDTSVATLLRQLAEAHDVIADLRQEVAEYEPLLERQSDLLRRTANALKGQPAALSSHDLSDLPEVAAAVRALADRPVDGSAPPQVQG